MNIDKVGNIGLNNNINTAQGKVSDDNFEKRLKQVMDKNDDKELRKVCKDFESIMLNMMYKQMKATVSKSDLIPDDAGREVFESMLDEKLMEEASKGEGFGLADVLYKQLSRSNKASYRPKNGG